MSDLIALVTEVEADVHEEGWDFQPCTFVLVDDDEGDGQHFEMLMLPLQLFPDVAECMTALAERGMRLHDRALGLLLINEAWGVTLDASAINEDGTYFGVSPSQSPDRIECRMATLLTKDGRMICGQRERLKDTFEIHEANDEDKTAQMKARVPYLMHVLLTGEEPE